MSNKKDNEFAQEHLTPEIARKQIIDVYKSDRVPPAVGIFDSPTRCFVVNTEWWSHISGMVHWLADVAAWKDAENEEYFAIREILKFMQGIECMDFQLRQSPDDNCILQQTTDGGDTWSDVFDFSLCATIQDASQSVAINNSVTYVQPTFQEIYNNYTTNYAGNPSDVYPDLSQPAGNDSAFRAAYCNAVFTLVNRACDAAISYYRENVDAAQNEINVGLGIAAFMLAAISLAAAVPTGGASLVGLAPAAALWATGISLGAVLGNALVDFWQAHTIDEFQDTITREDVTCFIIDEVAAEDNSLAAMQTALSSNILTGNAGTIADFLSLMLAHDATYAAFLEKWNNNVEYANAGIDLYCPCEEDLYRVWVWDFANGMGDFTFQLNSGTPVGTLVGGRLRGIDIGDQKAVIINMVIEPTMRFKGVKLYIERINGVGNGQDDGTGVRVRPTPNSTVGQLTLQSSGFQPNGVQERCGNITVAPQYLTGGNQLNVTALVTDNATSQIYIDRIEIMFVEGFAKGGYTTDDDNLCA